LGPSIWMWIKNMVFHLMGDHSLQPPSYLCLLRMALLTLNFRESRNYNFFMIIFLLNFGKDYINTFDSKYNINFKLIWPHNQRLIGTSEQTVRRGQWYCWIPFVTFLLKCLNVDSSTKIYLCGTNLNWIDSFWINR
jgi:hypothetical protein